MKSFIAVIDFDGTIVSHEWEKTREEVKGSAKTIKMLLDKGVNIIIWTCRTPNNRGWLGIEGVHEWLKIHGLEGDPRIRVNENFESTIRNFNGDQSRKVFGHVYVDDRNLFGLPLWESIGKEISKMAEEFYNGD
jgi:hypothetical protein